MMHQDHRELPEWIQREADSFIARERRQRLLAGICGSLIAGAMVLGVIALGMMLGELDTSGPAPIETPIAP